MELARRRLTPLIRELGLKLVILFGSYAQGRHTAASDIDLLVVHAGESNRQVYSRCWDALKMPQLQLHVYTVTQYRRLKASGSALPKEAEKGIRILG